MATRGIAVKELECNLSVSGNGCDISYEIAITDPNMKPVYQGAIIDTVTVNLTNTDTLAQFETKLKNAIQARAAQDGFTVSVFVIPTYKVA
jgi:hypothetical protein